MNRTGLFGMLLLGLLVLPASADDGAIPGATLSFLGLGEMQMMSAEEGMGVRGQSASARSAAASAFSVTLVDPFSGSVITQSGGQSSVGTDENAGLNATASASSSTNAQATASTIVITTGASTFNAAISALSSATLGAARGTIAAVLVP